jgi:hypothetical protein
MMYEVVYEDELNAAPGLPAYAQRVYNLRVKLKQTFRAVCISAFVQRAFSLHI